VAPGEAAAHCGTGRFEGGHIRQQRGNLGVELADLRFELGDLGL